MRAVANDNSERGGSLIFFTICLTMIIGFTGLAIDGGRLWVERRNLVTATDAGALAGAYESIDGTNGCDEAEDFVDDNSPQSDDFDCLLNGDRQVGSIEVAAESDVDLTFMRILGANSSAVQSTTKVDWRPDSGGMRPFGVCAEADGGAPQAWLDDPTYTVTFRVYFLQTVEACVASGSAPGNWGAVDFNGGSNSTSEFNDWIRNGYSDPIRTADNTLPCDLDSYGCYSGDPGTFSNSNGSALRDLMNSGEEFTFPIFSNAGGTGSNFDMKMIAVAKARLVDVKVNGTSDRRYIDLELQAGGLVQYQDQVLQSKVAICGTKSFDAC